MATMTAMRGLWNVIQSMSLTESNKRWLAERLVEPASDKPNKLTMAAIKEAQTETLDPLDLEHFDEFLNAL